ncbi:MAG TPA: aminotransferase class IV [Streptosporangiaceae bacterium]
MRVWVNGAMVDEAEARVSFRDHGLVVGDGVFEAMKIVDGRPFAMTRHLARLRRSAMGLGLGAPDLDAIRDGAMRVIEAAAAAGAAGAAAGDSGGGAAGELGRLRVTVTGGPGPLGSGRGEGGALTMVVAYAAGAVPQAPNDVSVVPWVRNERGALAGLKTTSYGENVRALAYAHERGADEAIFANTAGNLCEGTGTNVFVVKDGELVTPPLASGCLAGVTRALVLEWVGGTERDLPLDALASADEAFLTSTTRDVMPIRAVDDRVLPAVPGPVTRAAMKTFAERAAADIDP